jgi:hypothetical protein
MGFPASSITRSTSRRRSGCSTPAAGTRRSPSRAARIPRPCWPPRPPRDTG